DVAFFCGARKIKFVSDREKIPDLVHLHCSTPDVARPTIDCFRFAKTPFSQDQINLSIIICRDARNKADRMPCVSRGCEVQQYRHIGRLSVPSGLDICTRRHFAVSYWEMRELSCRRCRTLWNHAWMHVDGHPARFCVRWSFARPRS